MKNKLYCVIIYRIISHHGSCSYVNAKFNMIVPEQCGLKLLCLYGHTLIGIWYFVNECDICQVHVNADSMIIVDMNL